MVHLDTREIYSNPPLRLVAFEVRFPFSSSLESRKQLESVLQRLARDFPLPEYGKVSVFEPPALPREEPFARAKDRTSTWAIQVRPTALIIETTAYQQFERFAEVVRSASDALFATASIPGIARLGLRYIDEIRVPGVQRVDDWSPYIAPSLLSGALGQPDGVQAQSFQSVVNLSAADEARATLRYGAFPDGGVVIGEALRSPAPQSEPFFLIDVDSYWEARAEVPPFSPDLIVQRLVQLRLPVRRIFEASITEHLRDTVFRQKDES